MSALRSDSAVADTATPLTLRAFHSPALMFDSVRQAMARVRETPGWPLPEPADFAVGDLADWLVFQPVYDVDDATGAGQARHYTRWGLADRQTEWSVNDRRTSWQHFDFPQSARADAVLIPSFDYDSVAVGDHLRIRRRTDWPYRARSSYFLRQGAYGETYSQGRFRRLFPSAYGVDLGFAYYSNRGPYFSDDRNNSYIRLQLVGPFRDKVFWSARLFQYQDKTSVLLPQVLRGMRPRRDDLLYLLETALYRPADSTGAGWTAGLTLQSSKYDLTDPVGSYRLESHARTWNLWGRRLVRGWLMDADVVWDDLRLGSATPSRWGLQLTGRRTGQLGTFGSTYLDWTVSDWDTDPLAVGLSASVSADRTDRVLYPTLRVQRRRLVPTLFDRTGESRTAPLVSASDPVLNTYVEVGNPGLRAEWRNEASVVLATHRDSTARGIDFVLEGHLAYVEGYTRWMNTSESDTLILQSPDARDARTVGLAMGLHAPLFWKLEIWANYAAKYAESIDHVRLPHYNPQKASAVISWIAPQLRYKIDIRLNSALVWWFGDRRIVPTPYTSSPNVVRWDLSASARMQSFTFYYSVQNVTGFPYRTDTGEDFAGRTVRFGLNWGFRD